MKYDPSHYKVMEQIYDNILSIALQCIINALPTHDIIIGMTVYYKIIDNVDPWCYKLSMLMLHMPGGDICIYGTTQQPAQREREREGGGYSVYWSSCH